eukprot:CAMPEP_0185259604 /NCGR_PEP_ID=MMETSP1359-20130426/8352_1 /TAXON_ID=552665 /ORGANISM="Bigelowiella longifila, Strain CCMP242" /LENGTH=71 /DNA_ID=CAMNT_0027845569 /DNA_START=172 /DNA_END=387 /DNA_ORIENTATION=+
MAKRLKVLQTRRQCIVNIHIGRAVRNDGHHHHHNPDFRLMPPPLFPVEKEEEVLGIQEISLLAVQEVHHFQ